jgi:hypothetical protein
MSLVTVEVQLDHGRVIPKGTEPLPEKATALLTILADESGTASLESAPKPLTEEEAREFINRWAGKMELREDKGDDPKLTYLLKKYCRD